jgi:hypothetical protein
VRKDRLEEEIVKDIILMEKGTTVIQITQTEAVNKVYFTYEVIK